MTYEPMRQTEYRSVKSGEHLRSDNPIKPRNYMHGSGTVVKEHSTKPVQTMCHGCRDDFYNGEGADQCWGFKTAKVVDKVGHSTLNVCNGPDTIMRRTLSCWHAVSR